MGRGVGVFLFWGSGFTFLCGLWGGCAVRLRWVRWVGWVFVLYIPRCSFVRWRCWESGEGKGVALTICIQYFVTIAYSSCFLFLYLFPVLLLSITGVVAFFSASLILVTITIQYSITLLPFHCILLLLAVLLLFFGVAVTVTICWYLLLSCYMDGWMEAFITCFPSLLLLLLLLSN